MLNVEGIRLLAADTFPSQWICSLSQKKIVPSIKTIAGYQLLASMTKMNNCICFHQGNNCDSVLWKKGDAWQGYRQLMNPKHEKIYVVHVQLISNTVNYLATEVGRSVQKK